MAREFFDAPDWEGILHAGWTLAAVNDREDVPRLLGALSDPSEARRLGAVHALGFSRDDGRVINPIIAVLLNQDETPRVRAEAAECLAYRHKRRAIRPLIECTRDASADVRLWCVFALGEYSKSRHGLPRRAIIQALRARLGDHARPGLKWIGWTIHLEALARLARRDSDRPETRLFRDTILGALNDPLKRPDLWQWTVEYWESLDCGRSMLDLFNQAIWTIARAGFDPVAFGRHMLTPEKSKARE